MNATKAEILSYISFITHEFNRQKTERHSTAEISRSLNISRSLTSQYLNELFRDGFLIKVAQRPVLFFHKQMLENLLEMNFSICDFEDMEELLIEIRENTEIKRGFKRLIGESGSLKTCVEVAKSALSYPPNGIPLLIYGEAGSGKKTLLQSILEYAYDKKLIKEEKVRHIQCIKEDKFNNNFRAIIFGDNVTKGTLDNRDIDMLIITDIENLTKGNQALIYSLIKNKSYINPKNNKQVDINARIILTTSVQPNNHMLQELYQSIPLIIRIPNIYERSDLEKEELVIHFLKYESIVLERKIYISTSALGALVNHEYVENVTGIKKIVQHVCAKVNLSYPNEDKIYINIYHLPDEVVSTFGISNNLNLQEINYLDIMSYRRVDIANLLIDFFDNILETTESHNENFSTREYLEAINKLYEKINHEIFLQKDEIIKKKLFLEQAIQRTIEETLNAYHASITVNDSWLLGKIIYLSSQLNPVITKWKETNAERIQKNKNFLENKLNDEFFLVERIHLALLSSCEIRIDTIGFLILALVIAKVKDNEIRRRFMAIVIAHGSYSATSIAQTANTLLGSHVFDAINMPLESSMKDIIDSLKRAIRMSAINSDILLLVDMGSLEGIDSQLADIDRNIGIINNISTGMAIDIGFGIVNGMDMKEILERAIETSKPHYRIIEKKSRRNLLIFVSDNGIHMAKKLKNLFMQGLADEIDLDVEVEDYAKATSSSYLDGIKSQYSKVVVTGTFGPISPREEYIPIEEMLRSTKRYESFFSRFMNPIEIQQLKDSLVKNFSLLNVISHLTILEPNKLLDFVIEATNKLENLLNLNLGNETLLGMYIHISCLVERLVTKDYIDSYLELENFIDENEYFIKHVKRSFDGICRHYRIEIPISEIAYLHDYISNDKRGERNNLGCNEELF